jgi:ABC-type phosphate/phosphonate transport system substrate-binding protein
MAAHFYAFNAWYKTNMSLAWDDLVLLCDVIGIPHAPVLYRGSWDEKVIRSLYPRESALGGEQEGYVVANANSFHFDDFKTNVAKFVRFNHVQTDEHWMFQAPKENIIALPNQTPES